MSTFLQIAGFNAGNPLATLPGLAPREQPVANIADVGSVEESTNQQIG